MNRIKAELRRYGMVDTTQVTLDSETVIATLTRQPRLIHEVRALGLRPHHMQTEDARHTLAAIYRIADAAGDAYKTDDPLLTMELGELRAQLVESLGPKNGARVFAKVSLLDSSIMTSDLLVPHLERIMCAAEERERAEIGGQAAAAALSGNLELAAEILARHTDRPVVRRPEPQHGPSRETAAALLADPNIPDIRWFVPGVLREGLALLVGAPFIGKTPALVQLAIALAAGERWMDRFRCRPTRVLYVGTEYSRADVRKTLRDSLGREQAPEHLYIRTIENIPELPEPESLIAWLNSEMDDTGAEVVILDVLTAILPNGRDWRANVYRGDYQELKPYHSLGLERHVCIVGGWHGSKRETDPALMYNGSTGMWAVAGGGRLVMYRDKEKGTHLAAYTRGGEPLDLTLEQRLQNGWRRWAVTEETNTPAGLEGVQRAVYGVLSEAAAPMGPGAIFDKLTGLVNSLNSVKSALRQLLEKGHIAGVQGLYTVAGPEEDDPGDPDDLNDPRDLGDLRDPNLLESMDHGDPSVIHAAAASASPTTPRITRITDHADHARTVPTAD